MKPSSRHLKAIPEILLYAYIWQIPFAWRVIFDPSRSEWNSRFNEYMDISLYIGEIFIGFALLTHIVYYKSLNKSIFRYVKEKWKILFHVEQRYFYTAAGILLFFLNLLGSIDVLLSLVSILHIVSILVFILLFFQIYVSRGTKFIQNVFLILSVSLIFQLLIAFLQVFSATSVGLTFLNESRLFLEMENVAKSNIFSHIYLRAYGTFLHPNILAAYALLVATLSIYIRRSQLFHVEHYIYIMILSISGITILLSQSKIALLFFLVTLVWYFNKKSTLFHVEQTSVLISTVFISIIVLIFLNNDARQSFQTRINQFSLQSEITVKEFFIGSGIGTYRLNYDKVAIDWWYYEPVHFIPIIMFKELGIFIFLGGVIYLITAISYVLRGTIDRVGILIAFIAYGFTTDHFAWDIYQGTTIIVISFLMLYIDKYNNILYNTKSEKTFYRPKISESIP